MISIDTLIPLQVIIPMIAAPIAAMMVNKHHAWSVAALASWISWIIAILLLNHTLNYGPTSYHMGGWAPPIGIEYRVDLLNSFILTLVTSIASITILYARKSLLLEVSERKQPIAYCVYLLCLTGLLGITITNDAFNIYVFLEISSLATYTLIAIGKHRKALFAAFEYLILGTIGATFYLIGIGLLYMMTGTLNITDLANRIPTVEETHIIITAFSFITIGLALKIALFPLHLWLCNAYTYAPHSISAFLSATATKVSLYVLIRIIFTLFGIEFAFSTIPLGNILMTLSIAAILLGSLAAIYQQDIKRLLAYSSVAQIGYITLGISLASQAGLTASLTHVFNHALAKGGLFMVCGAVAYRFGGTTIKHFHGIGKQMPYTTAACVILGLSLIGVPLTAGFISKWQLLSSAFDQQLWLIITTILISSLLAILYVWRIIEAAYFQAPPKTKNPTNEVSIQLQIPIWIMALASIYFGIDTTYTLDIANQIAQQFLGASQ